MISKKMLDTISQISQNIDNFYKDLNISHRESILARLAKLNEETWELNSDILDYFFKKDKFNEDNLKWEFADVIICALILADKMKMDINKAIEYKLKIIEWRWIR